MELGDGSLTKNLVSSRLNLPTVFLHLILVGHNGWGIDGQNPYHEIYSLHPSYMFNAPEVTNEYNLLNDFLCSSLLEEGAKFSNDENGTGNAVAGSITKTSGHSAPKIAQLISAQQPRDQHFTARMAQVPTPIHCGARNIIPIQIAQETYYMTAADPAGSDTPEERMNKLLDAKYKAGLLRPFNYVNGYKRLQQYMDRHLLPNSRQRILRQLDKFRPKFRERIQRLTDVELVLVEMWFERKLMEYDRIFASMAVPACCWRRTGEIFRGNEEMAQLIHVPIEQLRDVSLMCLICMTILI